MIALGLNRHIALVEGQRVTEWDERGGLLGRHDACQNRSIENGALFVLETLFLELAQQLWAENDDAAGSGIALGNSLGANINHPGMAALIQMRVIAHGCRLGQWEKKTRGFTVRQSHDQ